MSKGSDPTKKPGQAGQNPRSVAAAWPALWVCRSGYYTLASSNHQADSVSGLLVANVTAVENGCVVIPTPATFVRSKIADRRAMVDLFCTLDSALAVRDFANRFGFLGSYPRYYEERLVEPLDLWFRMAPIVARARLLVSRVGTKFEPEFEDRQIIEEGRPNTDPGSWQFSLDDEFTDQAILRKAKYANDETWFNCLPQRLVNEWIMATATTVFDFKSKIFLAVPRNLMGIIWMQVAHELSVRALDLKRCEACGSLFIAHRPNMKYCPDRNDACRKSAQRAGNSS
jgi:hypothetical protein